MDATDVTHLVWGGIGTGVVFGVLQLLYLLVGVRYAKWCHKNGFAEPEKRAVALLKASRPNSFTFCRERDEEDKSRAAAQSQRLTASWPMLL